RACRIWLSPPAASPVGRGSRPPEEVIAMTLPTGTPTQLFIDGTWRDGSHGGFPVLDPATGEPLCEVPRAGTDDLKAALAAAAAAQPEWAATAPRTRAEALRKTFELMTER